MDDTQLYIIPKPDTSSLNSTVERMEKCIKEIAEWMRTNFLQLNGDNFEYLIFRYTQNLGKLKSVHIDQGSVSIASQAMNLSIIFDSNFTLEECLCK